MNKKNMLVFMTVFIPLGLLALALHTSAAAGPAVGCKPYLLTVKTGQVFYFTVAVTETIDLYAWQMDATYYPEYLEFLSIAPGPHLRSDGAADYMVYPVVAAGGTTNEIRLAAETRLGKDTGIDGSGDTAYLFFKAVKKKTDGTNVTLNDRKFVDRNAREITLSLINSARCKVTISDTAPPLIQPAINPLYLPVIMR